MQDEEYGDDEIVEAYSEGKGLQFCARCWGSCCWMFLGFCVVAWSFHTWKIGTGTMPEYAKSIIWASLAHHTEPWQEWRDTVPPPPPPWAGQIDRLL